VKKIDKERLFFYRRRLNRRTFILGLSTTLFLYSLTIKSSAAIRFDKGSIKALTFDVFGTVVDWRGSIISEAQLLASRKDYEVNWGKFADA